MLAFTQYLNVRKTKQVTSSQAAGLQPTVLQWPVKTQRLQKYIHISHDEMPPWVCGLRAYRRSIEGP